MKLKNLKKYTKSSQKERWNRYLRIAFTLIAYLSKQQRRQDNGVISSAS